jgi:hypothetical protein
MVHTPELSTVLTPYSYTNSLLDLFVYNSYGMRPVVYYTKGI